MRRAAALLPRAASAWAATMSASEFTAAQYAAKAQEFVEKLQPELAVASFAKALAKAPSDHQIMTDFAALLLDMGEFQQAGEISLSTPRPCAPTPSFREAHTGPLHSAPSPAPRRPSLPVPTSS